MLVCGVLTGGFEIRNKLHIVRDLDKPVRLT
jgi:hypothetical protein